MDDQWDLFGFQCEPRRSEMRAWRGLLQVSRAARAQGADR